MPWAAYVAWIADVPGEEPVRVDVALPAPPAAGETVDLPGIGPVVVDRYEPAPADASFAGTFVGRALPSR